jgi:hypothetical protein
VVSGSFEVERFEWTAGDRLELAGRWFHVRGRRFLRPTLDVEVDGRIRRLLATLEHKPWASEEGEEWQAAFTWDGEVADIDAAQLTVGPDLAVELGPPATSDGLQSRRRKAVGPELGAARAELKQLRAELERERDERRAEADDLRERLAGAEETGRSLRATLHGTQEQASVAQAAAERRREELERERDAALAERAEIAGELEVARRERDAARGRLTSTESELDALARVRDEGREERNRWQSRARDAAAERDAALAARDAAVAERDAAIAQRDAAYADRQTALAAAESMRAERRIARADREAAQREREAARRERETVRTTVKAEPVPSGPPRVTTARRRSSLGRTTRVEEMTGASFPPPVPAPGERHVPGSPIQLGLTASRRVHWFPAAAALAAIGLIAVLILLLVT